MSEKKKVKKSCNNCAFKVKLKTCKGDKNDKSCSKWKYLKANCTNCIYLKDCSRLGKDVSIDFVCRNHKKIVKSIKN